MKHVFVINIYCIRWVAFGGQLYNSILALKTFDQIKEHYLSSLGWRKTIDCYVYPETLFELKKTLYGESRVPDIDKFLGFQNRDMF